MRVEDKPHPQRETLKRAGGRIKDGERNGLLLKKKMRKEVFVRKGRFTGVMTSS